MSAASQNQLGDILTKLSSSAGDPAAIISIVNRARFSAGEDWTINELSYKDLVEGRFPRQISEAFFTFNELLAFLLAKEDVENEDYPVGIMAISVCAHCFANGYGDIDFIFDKALDFFRKFSPVIESKSRLEMLIFLLNRMRVCPEK